MFQLNRFGNAGLPFLCGVGEAKPPVSRKMKVSKYISLPIFYQLFGAVRVLETARALRKSTFTGGSTLTAGFPTHSTELDSITAGTFFYVLMASRGAKDVGKIVDIINNNEPFGQVRTVDAQGNIIWQNLPVTHAIGYILFDRDSLNLVKKIEVSKKDGTTWFHWEDQNPSWFVNNNDGVDIDGNVFERDLNDVIEFMHRRLIVDIHRAIKSSR